MARRPSTHNRKNHRNPAYLAHLAARAQSHKAEVRFVLIKGGERVGRVVRRSTDESLLDADPKKWDRGSTVVLHLDDGGMPLPINEVGQILRAPER